MPVIDDEREMRKSNGNLIATLAVPQRPTQETRFTERPTQNARFGERPNQDTRFNERSTQETRLTNIPTQNVRFGERPNQETRFQERPKFETENVRIHSGGFPTDSLASNDRQLSPGFSIVSTDAFDSESLDSAIGISPTVRRHHYEPLNKGSQSRLNGNGDLLKK
jgi:hypothetical protein